MSDFQIQPRGPFTLNSAARFIAGWAPTAPTSHARDDSLVRLAFLVDDWSGHAGTVLRQHCDGTIAGTIEHSTAADPARVRDQAARILSLDHDGTAYCDLGKREPVIRALQHKSGWLRPVLFHSPYEAACWGALSLRMRQSQAASIRDRLSAAHGTRLAVAGQEMVAFPTPERLLDVTEAEGIPKVKLQRLHTIAQAALDGRLNREHLLRLDPDVALRQLRALPGIGEFWSQAILLRAVGPTDVITTAEPRLRTAAARAFDTPKLANDDAAFYALTKHWRPFRTWVSVLVRSTA